MILSPDELPSNVRRRVEIQEAIAQLRDIETQDARIKTPLDVLVKWLIEYDAIPYEGPPFELTPEQVSAFRRIIKKLDNR